MPLLVSTRETFGSTLLELGKENANIVVIGGDLNKSTFANIFGAQFPERFFDFGPAEQNMMSVAAGFASSGKIPFVNTFAVFATGRCYDQIRVGIAQPHLNVKIVATHAGIITGEDGVSAQGIEDITLMSALPGFNVVVPSDSIETDQAVRAAAAMDGPFYIRLSRAATEVIHQDDYKFSLGQAEILRQGKDLTIIACGIMVSTALNAAEIVSREGINCRVINMHTIQPLDVKSITKAAQETGAIVTVEEHLLSGSLSSLVSQCVSTNYPVPIEMVGLHGYAESGTAEELLTKYGLTSNDIVKSVRKVLKKKTSFN